MQEITDKQKKELLLAIMVDIDKCCRENNICYSLSGGSLLGAVRHKGFIPWDDDMDVFMPRPDYERFLECYKHYNPRYHLFTFQTDKVCHSRFGKVYDKHTLLKHPKCNHGVSIDVFPVDGLPEGNDLDYYFKGYIKRADAIVQIRHCYRQTDALVLGMLKYVLKRLMQPLPRKVLVNRFYAYINQYPFGKTKHVAAIANPVFGWKSEVLPTEVFSEIEDVEFEGKQFRAIKNHHLYLSNMYGDYMALPPEEKRKATHGDPVFWIKQ